MLTLLLLLLAVILHDSWDGLPRVYVDAGVVGLTKFLRTRKPIGDSPSSWWPAKPGPSLSARAKRQDNLNTGKVVQEQDTKEEVPIALGQRKRGVVRDEDGMNTKFPTGYLCGVLLLHPPTHPP